VPETSAWTRLTQQNPGHSAAYVQRFRDLAAAGQDLGGEARLVDALVPRRARVLDAGSGTGRVGGVLHAAGHEVVGVDGDPELVAAAQADHPGPTWLAGDLAELDLPARGIAAGFDAVVCAGNVMTFLAPGTRREVLRRLLAHLAPSGRGAFGFGAGRGYPFAEFLDDARAAGWATDLLLSTWDLRPFTEDADFLVALLRPAGRG
jgi:SAM-dependent methyltransferase